MSRAAWVQTKHSRVMSSLSISGNTTKNRLLILQLRRVPRAAVPLPPHGPPAIPAGQPPGFLVQRSLARRPDCLPYGTVASRPPPPPRCWSRTRTAARLWQKRTTAWQLGQQWLDWSTRYDAEARIGSGRQRAGEQVSRGGNGRRGTALVSAWAGREVGSGFGRRGKERACFVH
jgi:hypothetical protein